MVDKQELGDIPEEMVDDHLKCIGWQVQGQVEENTDYWKEYKKVEYVVQEEEDENWDNFEGVDQVGGGN